MVTGVVFNIQRFSIHDGPGIRTTVFMKGCPLSCWWCHNPESRDARPAVSLLPERCIECESCVDVCPTGLAHPIAPGSGNGQPTDEQCLRCGKCAEACPSGARTLIGSSYTVDSLLRELDKDELFYDESGGGVTFSGGEPIMPSRNSEFLLACLAACRERGFHRAVDTAGYVARDKLLEVAELTDLFLYDLKHMDDALHQHYVGVSNTIILENLKALAEAGCDVWIRVPLIPGINDDEANVEATATFVASLGRPYPIHLLPYHKVGGDKYRRIGMEYLLKNVEPPKEEHTAAIADRMRSFGPEVKIGG
jgi:pyruvate formate lyase activating enzyme